MKNKKRKIRSEKGSITIFVIVTMLFIVIASLLLYSRVMNNKSTENRQVKQIENQYSVSNDQLAEVYNDVSSHVTVTFDANGGQVSTSPKRVKIGDSYGSLPTPTRDGYKFMGWNGKNLFNIDDFIETYAPYQNTKPEKVEFQGEEVWKIYGHVNPDGRSINYMEGKFKENTPYTCTVDAYSVYLNNYSGIRLYFTYTDESYENWFYDNNDRNDNEWNHPTKVSNANKTISRINVTYGTGSAYDYIKGIQIEEGSEATEYEPYFVTSSTKVTQTKDHTLTAIWEEE